MKEEVYEELNLLNSSLAGSKIDMPYRVPSEYFDANAQSLSHATKVGINYGLPIHKNMPYQVPDLYFDSLAQKVIDKAEKKKKAVLLSFATIRWAAAATLFIMVGAAIAVSIQRQNYGSQQTFAEVKVADRDIEAYFADNVKPDMVNLPDVSYLDNTTEVALKEIIYYLDQTGWDTEYYN